MRRTLALALLLSALAAPLAAQSVDFGDDTSRWSNDGECDDSRFTGPGMTRTPLLDTDIGHDATDCGTAYRAGRLTLRSDVPMSVPGSDAASGKPAPAPFVPDTVVDGINFGKDSGGYTNDGQCDDRRFTGPGMAAGYYWEDIGADASDCAAAYAAGRIRLWDYTAAKAATVCAAIDFGDDNGTYPNDFECDDLRFEGPGVAAGLQPEDQGHDASDCSRLCAFGVIALRDY